MSLWKDVAGKIYDDDNGKAQSLPAWPSGLVQLTAAEISALQPTSSQIAHQQLLQSAQNALIITDKVAHRCFKAGIAFPAAWQSYTLALRAIVNGTDTTSTTLPTQPAYPAGT